ncbi:MAG: NADPH:quinone reductase [Verrucomicrobiota bacterium]
MKAAYIEKPGPPETLVFAELPDPTPGPGEVLVKVGAASVNPIDTYIRSGMIPMELPLPFVPGCDLAGEVEAVGAGVTRFEKGDRVWGSNQGLLGRQGTCAEKAVVGEEWLYPTPNGVSDQEAAAVSLVGITAHLGLTKGQLQPGETVFVNGGAGGVGSMVVQMAHAMGARVLCSAGSDERVRACLALGGEAGVNYRTGDPGAWLAEEASTGVDLWWETTREPDLGIAVTALAENGRLILMAGREARPEFPIGPFYVKACQAIGFVMFKEPATSQRKTAEEINRWMAEGRLKARIDRELPLSEIAEAHRLQEAATIGNAGGISGKIVLIP